MRKKIGDIIVAGAKKIFKPEKTTGTEVVQPFKFKPAKNKLEKVVKDLQIATQKESGKIKRYIKRMESDIEPFRRKLRQTTQKVAGEKVTKSGFSKGKNIKPKKEKGKVKTFIAPKDFNKGGRVGKMGGGMMSRRFGMKKGSSKGKVPTTSKEKAFGMLSVKAKKDNNPNITFTDKIVGAKKT